MNVAKRILAAVILSAAWLATGCPQLMSDDFDIVPAGSGDASLGGGSGGTGSGGTSGDTGVGGTGGLGGSGGATPCGTGDSGDTCPNGQTCCDGVCADLLGDEAHCGTCATGCPGTICVSGSCGGDCFLGFLDCDQTAGNGCEADSNTDPENCGSCNAKCSFDQTCMGGKCNCPPGTRNCDGDLDTGCETLADSDPNNCGACGKTCGANQECASGTCGCLPGYADCNTNPDDGCEAHLADDPDNCGACGTSCDDHGACAASTCGCDSGYQNCDATVGCEVPLNDPQHCGNCTKVCSGTTPNCDGTNCVATCPGTQMQCGSSCVDLDTDPQHCGSCNNAAQENQVCVNGTLTCKSGFGNCTATPGCETDLTSDPAHCGTCPNACKSGAVCSNSACSCAATTPNDCGSSCEQCCGNADCIDPNACTTDTCNAGSCVHTNCAPGSKCCANGCFECCVDNDCTGGQVCSGNQCVMPTCSGTQTLCNGVCVDTSTSAQNCGGCGLGCGIGRSCSSSKCTPAWVPVGTTGAPAARSRAAHAVLGATGQLFVWGGQNAAGTALDTGAIYDVTTNTWTNVVKDANTPSARVLASAVWTGTKVFVWGGAASAGGTTHLGTGALYDPATTTWTPISAVNAPSARRAPYVVWTGGAVLVFSGLTNVPVTGAFLYDPQNDMWTTVSATSQPNAELSPTVGWTGTNFFVYGGSSGNSVSAEFHRYTQGAWSILSDGPSKRFGAFGGWDGAYFIAWGGRKLPQPVTYADGQRYSSTSWGNMAAPNSGFVARIAPHREHGWSARISGQNTLMLGGLSNGDAILKNGAIYNSATNGWTDVPPWTANEDHRFGVGAFVGSEMVVWGGETGGAPTATGERYLP